MLSLQSFLTSVRHGKSSEKWRRYVKPSDCLLSDPNKDDLVIVIMGPTGVGKSTLLNNYFEDVLFRVGDGLKSCTQQISCTSVSLPEDHQLYPGRRLVLVDTPGFDDTYVSDYETLRSISVWLASVYNDEMTVAGVIYLNDISQKRMLGSARLNYKMFQKLCGTKASAKVLMSTTHWDTVDAEVAEKRESELKADFWHEILAQGACLMRSQEPSDSHRIIEHALRSASEITKEIQQLQIQEELIDLGKRIPDTDAGKQLRRDLKELKEMRKSLRRGDAQKRQEYRDKVEEELKLLEGTIFDHLRDLFHFREWF